MGYLLRCPRKTGEINLWQLYHKTTDAESGTQNGNTTDNVNDSENTPSTSGWNDGRNSVELNAVANFTYILCYILMVAVVWS